MCCFSVSSYAVPAGEQLVLQTLRYAPGLQNGGAGFVQRSAEGSRTCRMKLTKNLQVIRRPHYAQNTTDEMLINREIENTPSILYKYRYFDIDEYHTKSLSENTIWCTSAKNFNDPFDCALSYDMTGTKQDKIKWARQVIKSEFPRLTDLENMKFAEDKIIEIENDPGRDEWIHDYVVETNYNKFGICCIAGNRDNLLMWSHYSQNHTGFCIGLSTTKLFDLQEQLAHETEELLEFHKVEYSDSIPIINFYEVMLVDDNKEHISPLVTTKSSHWEYEHEYRLIYWDKVNQPLTLLQDTIVEIIVGCRAQERDIQKIIDISQENGNNISILKAIKEKNQFKLRFEQIA